MPIIDYVKEYDFEIVTWDVFEKSEDLIKQLNLPMDKIEKFYSYPEKQGREYLGLQACLQALNVKANVLYSDLGKPYLDSGKEISISHSYQKVSIAVRRAAIGLDIEKKRDDKVLNIESKFIRPDEKAWIPRNKDLADYLHIIWGIKEGLYKINGGNLWNFLNHYKVEPFELIANKPITCWIQDKEKREKYTAYFRRINDFYLIWVIEK
ncbi:4'-phosphopantetheinyl transferase family protein [Ornithobacterium rhinotracheale]|uniref:4'-phosphopantetheinyl transferase family protein n=1 Tax=Ornithobacterium rhinotracheale TaxID=28251 RepID=UPI00387398C8